MRLKNIVITSAVIILVLIGAYIVYSKYISPAGPRNLTAEEKMQILNSLSKSYTSNLTEDQKMQVLESLSKQATNTPQLTEDQKLQILRSLNK